MIMFDVLHPAPTLGGPPSKGTKKDKRLKDNKPSVPQAPKPPTPKK